MKGFRAFSQTSNNEKRNSQALNTLVQLSQHVRESRANSGLLPCSNYDMEAILMRDPQLSGRVKRCFMILCSHGQMVETRQLHQHQWKYMIFITGLDAKVSDLFLDMVWNLSRTETNTLCYAGFILALFVLGRRLHPSVSDMSNNDEHLCEIKQISSLWVLHLHKINSTITQVMNIDKASTNPLTNGWNIRHNILINMAVKEFLPQVKVLFEKYTPNASDGVTMGSWVDLCTDYDLIPTLLDQNDAATVYCAVECDEELQPEDFIDCLLLTALQGYGRIEYGTIYVTPQSKVVALFSKLADQMTLTFDSTLPDSEFCENSKMRIGPLPVRIFPTTGPIDKQLTVDLFGVAFFTAPKKRPDQAGRRSTVVSQVNRLRSHRTTQLSIEILSSMSEGRRSTMINRPYIYVAFDGAVVKADAVSHNRVTVTIPLLEDLTQMNLFVDVTLKANNITVHIKWIQVSSIEVSHDGRYFSSDSDLSFTYVDEYNDLEVPHHLCEWLLKCFETNSCDGLMELEGWENFSREYNLVPPVRLGRGLPIKTTLFAAAKRPRDMVTKDSVTHVKQISKSIVVVTDGVPHDTDCGEVITRTGFLLCVVWSLLGRASSVDLKSSLEVIFNSKARLQATLRRLEEDNKEIMSINRHLVHENAPITCNNGHCLQVARTEDVQTCMCCKTEITQGDVCWTCTQKECERWTMCKECFARRSGVHSYRIANMGSADADPIREGPGFEKGDRGKWVVRSHNQPYSTITVTNVPVKVSEEMFRKLMEGNMPKEIRNAPRNSGASHKSVYITWDDPAKAVEALTTLHNKKLCGSCIEAYPSPALQLYLGATPPHPFPPSPPGGKQHNRPPPRRTSTLNTLSEVLESKLESVGTLQGRPFSATITGSLAHTYEHWMSKPVPLYFLGTNAKF